MLWIVDHCIIFYHLHCETFILKWNRCGHDLIPSMSGLFLLETPVDTCVCVFPQDNRVTFGIQITEIIHNKYLTKTYITLDSITKLCALTLAVVGSPRQTVWFYVDDSKVLVGKYFIKAVRKDSALPFLTEPALATIKGCSYTTGACLITL
jgi:hypothetical protein